VHPKAGHDLPYIWRGSLNVILPAAAAKDVMVKNVIFRGKMADKPQFISA
jgi:hypothetical protein